MDVVAPVLFTIAVAHFIIANLVALGLLGLALLTLRRRSQRLLRFESPDAATSPLTLPLSAVVPAYNEEGVVVDCVLGILQSAVPELEVIVVDDGSTDETAERLIAAFDFVPVTPVHQQTLPSRPIMRLLRSRTHPNVHLICKENGGKADAINAGINLARYRYVLLTDADSIFEPGSLLTAVAAIGFDAGALVGVGGLVRVRNGMTVRGGRVVARRLPSSLLGRFQVVEYMGAMTGTRAGWDAFNCVPVLSGAFSIWRRDVLLELGGMSGTTTHEDIEFTFRVHCHYRWLGVPYRVITLPDAVVWTEAPHRWIDLYRQRKRWQRVVLECVWRYRRMIANPRYGEVGTIMVPYMLIFEALGPLVEIGTIALVILLFAAGELSVLHTGLFLLFSTGLVAFTRIVSITADTWLYRRFPASAILSLAGVALLEFFLYRPVVLAARLMAFPEFLTGRKTWERARRETPI